MISETAGVLRRCPARDDECCHRVGLAQPFHICVVGIVSAGAKDQEITAIAFVAEPAKRLIQITATAHQPQPKDCFRRHVHFTAQADVLIAVFCQASRRGHDCSQNAKENPKNSSHIRCSPIGDLSMRDCITIRLQNCEGPDGPPFARTPQARAQARVCVDLGFFVPFFLPNMSTCVLKVNSALICSLITVKDQLLRPLSHKS